MMPEPPLDADNHDVPSSPPPTIPPLSPGSSPGLPPAFRPIGPPPPPQQQRGGRTVLWVFVALITGFLLPVCACAVLMITTTFSANTILNRLSETEEETGPAIGVIDLIGPISTGDGFGATTGNITEQLEWMADERDVKAVVIRANSPGGGINASDELWAAVRNFEKPVVFYMHGTCASGCLYIASGADEIIASRNSLVGSIGVISTFFDVSELLADVGVDVEVIVTGDNKDFGSFFREITPEERAFWRTQIEIVLNHFIEVVANRDGSTLTEVDVRALATGQVWIATEALDLGLIDGLGYEDDAIEFAANLAGVSGYRVQEYPFDFNFFDFFAPGFSAESYFALPDANDVLESLQQPPLQYRYFGPYETASPAP